jgi:hypothetical protein
LLERSVELAQRHENVADPLIRHREVALQARIAWVGSGEPLYGGKSR